MGSRGNDFFGCAIVSPVLLKTGYGILDWISSQINSKASTEKAFQNLIIIRYQEIATNICELINYKKKNIDKDIST